MKELNLSENDLSGEEIGILQIMLWNNRDLKKLVLSKCNIGIEAADAIGEGLKKNESLLHLDLSNNKFSNACMQSWSSVDCIGLFSLETLDLSNN